MKKLFLPILLIILCLSACSSQTVKNKVQPVAAYDHLIEQALLCMKETKIEKADQYLDQALKIDNKRADAYFVKGLLAYVCNNDLSISCAYFMQSLQHEKNFEQRKSYIRLMAEATSQHLSIKEADFYEKAFQSNEKEFYSEAVNFSQQGLALNSRNFLFYYELGFAYVQEELFQEAISSLLTGLKINPSSLIILEELRYVYFLTQNFNNELLAINNLIYYDGVNVERLYRFAEILEENKNEKKQAKQFFQIAVAKFPRDYPAYFRLGRLYFEEQNYLKCQNLLKNFIENANEQQYEKLDSENFSQNMSEAKRLYQECSNFLKTN